MTENIHHGNQSSVSPEERRRFRRWLWLLLGAAVLLTVVVAVELAENILQHRAVSLSGAPVAFSPDGHMLAAGSGDTIKLWEVQSGTLLHILSSIHMRYVLALAFSPDGHTLAAGTDARQASCTSDNNPPCLYGAILWDVQSGEVSSSSSFSPYTSFLTVSSLAFSPNGHALAIADINDVELWDRANDKELYALRQEFANAVAFSPDGRTLISSSSEYTSYGSSSRTFPSRINFWDVASGKLLRSIALPLESPINSITVSPDGRTLASGGEDHVIRLWDMATGTQLRTLRGHTGAVDVVVFSPDGHTLASGSWDATIKLWDAHSDVLLRTLTGKTGVVKTVAFSPDGRMLASGSIGVNLAQHVALWDVQSGSEVRTFSS